MLLQSGNMSKIIMMDVREALALQAALNKALSDFTILHCDVANRDAGGRVSSWVCSQDVGSLQFEEDGKIFPARLTVAVATPDLL